MSKKEKNSYSDKELKEFEALIQKKKVSAKEELDYYQDQVKAGGKDESESKFMSMDDGAGTLENEYLNKMASRQIQYIKHLDNALVRIKNKTYGICRETGKLINKKRLEAVPHATLSIEAKLAQKKR